MAQCQRSWGEDIGWRRRITLAGQDVENDIPTALAVTEYLLLSKRTRQVFETEAGTAWNPSNRPA
jgi:hypothetical protein